MQTDLLVETRRQAEICNACRYCEGYCAVFPVLHRERTFADGDLMQLANLCHNCRSCYYACQFTAPHEFDLNLPAVLAELRRESWEEHAWPQSVARMFHKSGVAIAVSVLIGFALLFAASRALQPVAGDGFYAVLSHSAMVAIFVPAFVLPLVSVAISLRRFWRASGGGAVTWRAVVSACVSAAKMKNLDGGHGDGCNFEDEDRFSHARRIAHQIVVLGFGLCFLSTISATILHYVLSIPAPYSFWSVPKLLGVPGGLLMVVGTAWLAALKVHADRSLADRATWGGEMAFTLLLFVIAVSGLALYWLGATTSMPTLLALHLGAVLSFFLLTPFTKMVHGFYRMAALTLAYEAEREKG